jgi:transcriptional regulator
MYIPDYFKVDDEDEIFSFLQANAFGQLISSVNGRLFCSHIPFLIDDDRKQLRAHLAKANDQWRELEDQEVLITFQGGHDYVSPSWYKTAGVPTWNYQAVHVYARCQLINDEEELSEIVDGLTRVYESSFEQPWQASYSSSMLKAIVGLRLKITDIQCKYKISQNHILDDQKKVAEQYRQHGDGKLYRAMQQSIQQQTPENKESK